MKLTYDASVSVAYPDVFQIEVDKEKSWVLTDEIGVVGSGGEIGTGGNSGFHAINLAIQFGATRLLLVGMDLTVTLGVHWHGRHPQPLNNPRQQLVDNWRRVLDGNSKLFDELGVKIINCSAVSTLMAYPKMTLREALGC